MNSESVPFLERLFRLAGSGWEDWAVKIIAAVIVALVVHYSHKFGRRGWTRLATAWRGSQRINRALRTVGKDSKGLWLAQPIEPPTDYKFAFGKSIPIIVVANLKGGVGKTTISGNLVAHYANRKHERVLAIDLDFQGSLTANSLSLHDRNNLLTAQSDGGLSKAARLIDDRDADWLLNTPDAVDGVASGKIIPTYYSLAAMENRVMVEWLLGERREDVRYQLTRILHDPAVQSTFDRIIIDAPPRLTTACVQALCAATHVLIPTVLDDLSTEAVAAFADQLRIHQPIWPHLKIVGVVGTMTRRMAPPLHEVEADALAAGKLALDIALQSASAPLRDATFLPTQCFIPDKVELSRSAGHRIVYASPSNAAVYQDIRQAFDRLGDEIDKRCGVSRRV